MIYSHITSFPVRILIPRTVIPVIHASTTPVTVNEGQTAVLNCNATGNPAPSLSWFRDSLPVPIPGSSRIQQTGNGSLLVGGAGREDQGEYVCRAENEVGSETATVVLIVNGEG